MTTKLLIAAVVLAALPLAFAEAQTRPGRDYPYSWRMDMQKWEFKRRKRAREALQRKFAPPLEIVPAPRDIDRPLPIVRNRGLRI